MCGWLCILVLYIYTSVRVCVNAHVIMTSMYACMDSIICEPAQYTYLQDWPSTNFELCTPRLECPLCIR